MVDGSKKNDSLEDGFFLEDDVFAAEPIGGASEERPSLKQIWQNNPSLKILAIVFFIAILLIGFLAFGSSKDDVDPKEDIAIVSPAAEVSQPPGTAEVSPAYEEAVRKVNSDRVEQAEMMGTSSLPTPIAKPTERIEAPVQIEETDVLSEWRKAAEERRVERNVQAEKLVTEKKIADNVAQPAAAEKELPVPVLDTVNPSIIVAQQPPPPPLPTAPTPEQIQGYMQMLQGQMQTVMETRVPKDSTIIKMNIENMFKPQEVRGTKVVENLTSDQAYQLDKARSLRALGPPLIGTGEIIYAQILIEANSDIPGPVIAQIASGPLVGGRAIGTFSVIDKSGIKKLAMTFNRIIDDNVEYQVNAIAIDPATTLGAIESEVDNHYLSRIIIPAAASFIEGFTDAATRKNTQVVVTNGTVVTDSNNELNTEEQLLEAGNSAGKKISEFVGEDSTRPVTIKVKMGTRIGMLFTQSVYDPFKIAEYQASIEQPGQTPGSIPGMAQGLFNATPAGQAINAINGFSTVNWGSQSQQMPQQMMNQAQQYVTGQPTGQQMQYPGQMQGQQQQVQYPGQMQGQQQQYQQPLIQNP